MNKQSFLQWYRNEIYVLICMKCRTPLAAYLVLSTVNWFPYRNSCKRLFQLYYYFVHLHINSKFKTTYLYLCNCILTSLKWSFFNAVFWYLIFDDLKDLQAPNKWVVMPLFFSPPSLILWKSTETEALLIPAFQAVKHSYNAAWNPRSDMLNTIHRWHKFVYMF